MKYQNHLNRKPTTFMYAVLLLVVILWLLYGFSHCTKFGAGGEGNNFFVYLSPNLQNYKRGDGEKEIYIPILSSNTNSKLKESLFAEKAA